MGFLQQASIRGHNSPLHTWCPCTFPLSGLLISPNGNLPHVQIVQYANHICEHTNTYGHTHTKQTLYTHRQAKAYRCNTRTHTKKTEFTHRDIQMHAHSTHSDLKTQPRKHTHIIHSTWTIYTVHTQQGTEDVPLGFITLSHLITLSVIIPFP